jgi:hypothetical protein
MSNMPFRPQTRPEGVSAGDYDSPAAKPQSIPQFKGGASYDTSGEYVRHPMHATSDGPVSQGSASDAAG